MTNTEIPEEAVKAAEQAYWHVAMGPGGPDRDPFEAALSAALPALRKQWEAERQEAENG